MTTSSNTDLLRVEHLSVSYGRNEVVSDVGFSLGRGGSLALIGESGSGKSTIARAVLRLLPASSARATGSVHVDGREVLALSEKAFRPLRGRSLGFVPQDPGTALNPVRTIGSQAHEAAALLGETDRDVQRERILEAFDQVGLRDPRRVYDAYPHQLSGGMLQRVLIGLTILPRPALIVADEPTSALDVTIQRTVLDLLSELRSTLGIGLLLITHDLAIAAERADSLVVLKDGVVQEAGSTGAVFSAPRSEYARKLQADVPALNPDRYRTSGVATRQADAAALTTGDGAGNDVAGTLTSRVGTPKIEVRGATKSYEVDGDRRVVLDDVSFAVAPGTTHALVGESGSGKTTAVRLLLGIEEPDAGEIVIDGTAVHDGSRASLRAARRHLQLVYQNPFTSLDPSWRVDRIVREPLDRYAVGDRADRATRVQEALASVGLAQDLWRRRPSALSGGQRQRVAIARALVLRPDVIVLDEPTSALDVSVQADIVDVLVTLQRELGLSYLFVSHDLALVRQLADTVTVLQSGRVVESGTVEQVFTEAQHDYTRALLAAIPRPAGGRPTGSSRLDLVAAV